jgi:hypothetical protein
VGNECGGDDPQISSEAEQHCREEGEHGSMETDSAITASDEPPMTANSL